MVIKPPVNPSGLHGPYTPLRSNPLIGPVTTPSSKPAVRNENSAFMKPATTGVGHFKAKHRRRVEAKNTAAAHATQVLEGIPKASPILARHTEVNSARATAPATSAPPAAQTQAPVRKTPTHFVPTHSLMAPKPSGPV